MTPLFHATMAKVLLFIALTVGPANPTSVYCTSHNESYAWEPAEYGWHVKALGFPASDFTRNPSVEASFSGGITRRDVPAYIRVIADHNWSRDGVVILDNGDRIEKRGDKAFYIMNAGGPNEKDFTIFYKTQ